MTARSTFFSIDTPVDYEGPNSNNPLAYRWYDKDRVVAGRRMEDHLRFAVCYWHSFCWQGNDPFGGETFNRPWHHGGESLKRAFEKADVAFEMFRLLDDRLDLDEDQREAQRRFAAIDRLARCGLSGYISPAFLAAHPELLGDPS